MDLIERQAAIDALGEEPALWSDNNEFELGQVAQWIEDVSAIKNLPSTQPEIIRCRDCKFFLPHYQLGFDEDNGVYHDYCRKLIPEDEWYAFQRKPDDFCSRAERRKDG